MSSYTQVTGTILINPPLRYAEIKHGLNGGQKFDTRAGVFIIGGEGHWLEIKLNTTEIETEEGVMHETSGISVTVVGGSGCSVNHAYGVVDDLKVLAKLCFENGHRLDGYLQGEGERNEDIWRIWVNDLGRVQKADAIISWREGTPGPKGVR